MTDATTTRRDRVLLVLLALCVFLPGLGSRDLWNPDEPRYAEVAREMRVEGDWFVPHVNGEVYSQKPPLLFWLIDLSSLATGGEVTEWSARLPSALAAVAAILLTFLIAERLSPDEIARRVAWLAAAVYGTCVKILWQGHVGQIDMLLSALVALAVWFWVRGYTERRPGFYRLFFLATGFATLAKGPVGLLPPLLSVVAYLSVVGERGEIRRMKIPTGLLLWALPVLAWLVPAGFDAGWPYLQSIVFKQNVTRYADPWHHFQPPWYYLTVIPGDFFPWSFVLPSALVVGWRRFVRAGRRGRAEVADDAPAPGAALRGPFLFGLCWMVATVVFFSISPAKRTVYILTMYPAMALLVALALAWWSGWAGGVGRQEGGGADGEAPRGPDRGWLLWPLGLLAGLTVLLPVAAPFVAARQAEVLEPLGPGLVPRVVTLCAVLALGAVAAWGLARRGRVRRAAFALAAGSALFGLGVFLLVLPRFDVVKSARGLSRTLVERMAPGEPYAIYPRLDAPVLFYTRRVSVALDGEQELRRFVARPGRKWLMIERDDLAKLDPPLPLVEVARDADRKDGYILMTDPPPSGREAGAAPKASNPSRAPGAG